MRRALSILICVLSLTTLLTGITLAEDKSYTEYLKEGNEYYKELEYEKAIKSYEKAAELEGDKYINVYFNLGLSYRHIKDYPSAVNSLEKFTKATTDKKMLDSAKKLISEMMAEMAKPTTTGTLKNYEVWEGWILVEGDVVVPEGITLIIKPGSLIMFTPLSSRRDEKLPYLKDEITKGFSSIIVRGQLIAQGEKDNEILFSNSFDDRTTKRIGLWGGIIFEGSKGSVLQHTKIEGSTSGVVFKGDPEVLFKNNVLLKNEIAVKVFDKSVINIDYNIFYRNEAGIDCRDDAKPKIINCNFTKNNYGIKLYDSAKPEIANNTFVENSSGIAIYDKAFPKITDNSFKDGMFGISMTLNSKALIMGNKFEKNKIGVNAVNNSSPKIYQNVFDGHLKSGISAVNDSKAEIDANTFTNNAVGIEKSKTVILINNKYEENTLDIKEIN